MTAHGIISALVIGLIIGALGRAVLPGRQAISIWLTLAVGVVAAFVGTVLVGPLRNTAGIDWVELIAQVGLAAVGVSILSGRGSRKRLR